MSEMPSTAEPLYRAEDLVHITEIAAAAEYRPLSTLWTWLDRHGKEGGPFEPVKRGTPPIFSWDKVGRWVCDRMKVDYETTTRRLMSR